MKILHNRRLQAIAALGHLIDLDPGQTLGAIDLDEFRIGINLATRNCSTPGNTQGRHSACGMIRGFGKDLEIHGPHHIGQLGELQPDPKVGLIRAKTLHGLGVCHHREGLGKLNIDGRFKDAPNHTLK